MTHVVLAADANYLDYARCSLAQLASHGRAAEGVVLLVPQDVNEADTRPMRQQAQQLGIDLDVVPIAEIEELQSRGAVASRGHVSTFTYSKLFLAEVMQDLDEVLYLDIDTLVRDDLTDLLNHRLQHPLGAVRELGDNGKRIFGTTRQPYFNAGVLRMSLNKLREEDFISSALAVLRKNPRLQFQDQDVLNIVFRDRHDALPLAYNVFDSLSEAALPAWKVLDDPAIVHFVGPAKPWQSNARSRHARDWRRVHAGLLGLSGEAAERYVNGASTTWQERVHGGITSARHSRPGQLVRSSLPLGLKDGLNRGLLTLLPPRSILADQVLKAMNEPPSVAPLDPIEPRALTAPDDSVTRRTPSLPPASRRTVAHTSHVGPLLLVISLPRSGTNALNSMLRVSGLTMAVEGEFYAGFVKEQTKEHLKESFPWVTVPNTAFRELINTNVTAVTEALLSDRTSLTVIKVFPRHLDDGALDQVLQTFRPRVILLRRRLLFSYISWLKARKAKSWFGSDTTDVQVTMSDSSAHRYIRFADRWFATVIDACQRANLEVLDLTYEDLLENETGHTALRSFLHESAATIRIGTPGRLKPTSKRQDQRTDQSLFPLLQDFSRLSPDVRDALLRYPGPGLET